VNVALAVTDITLVRSLVLGGSKLAVKGIGQVSLRQGWAAVLKASASIKNWLSIPWYRKVDSVVNLVRPRGDLNAFRQLVASYGKKYGPIVMDIIRKGPSEYNHDFRRLLINPKDPARAWIEELIHWMYHNHPGKLPQLARKIEEVSTRGPGIPALAGRTADELLTKRYLLDNAERLGLNWYDRWFIWFQEQRISRLGIWPGY
jgi:hypothetical protein